MTEDGKNGTPHPPERTGLIQLIFPCPGLRKSWGSNVAPSCSKPYISDYQSRALSRDTFFFIFSNIVLPLFLTQWSRPPSQSNIHHVVASTADVLGCHWFGGTWQTEEVICNRPFSDPSSCACGSRNQFHHGHHVGVGVAGTSMLTLIVLPTVPVMLKTKQMT